LARLLAIRSMILLCLLLSGCVTQAAVALQYHHVALNTPAITSISPADFAAHMAYLNDNDYNVVDIVTLIRALRDYEPLTDGSIVVTFDDAYQDILTNALPILERYGFPFTVFVATELVGSSSQYLDWSGLRALVKAGATLASHTHSHAHLLRRNDSETDDAWRHRIIGEITSATAILQDKIGAAPLILAYPYGEYNTDIIGVINELGYVAFGQQSGAIGLASNLAFLPRFPMSGIYADINTLRTKVQTLALPVEQDVLNPVLPIRISQPELQLNTGELSTERMACYGPAGKQPVSRISDRQILTRSPTALPVGRSRYNCTIPTEDGRYYWYSQMWLRKNSDGSWPSEP
jgi:peptidoglycan/xylan/chitin deacetylase (PgdA/CDA1 family)